MKRKRGIPIGAFTSQPLGNFILSAIDHAVKEKLKVKCYIRYCDDSVMLAKTKSEAQFLLKEYNRMCAEIGLVVKSNSFIAPIEYLSEGNIVGGKIDFLGYQFTNNKTLLRKTTKKRFARKIKKIKSRKRRKEILASYWGWCKHGDCKNLWNVITNNYMGFAEKGIKQSNRTKDGRKFYDVPTVRLMDILNVPITIIDFESGIKTRQGNDRYCVLFELNGEKKKFITNCFNIKDILDQSRNAESEGRNIFPVENVIIKRRQLSDGKSTYYFDE